MWLRSICQSQDIRGNGLQHLTSEVNQVYRDKRDYNLRNRSTDKPGSTDGDELREVMDSFRKQILENTNNKMRKLEEILDRFA